MALERHIIELSAKDNLSPAFQKAGRAAEDAARRGKVSAEDWGRAAAKVGAAIGGVVTVTSKLGQAHQAEALQLRALDRAYGDSADQLDSLAQSLQDMGIASDDTVRIAALGAQSLAKNYGLTTDEIETLIERSADLSQTTFDQYGNQLGLADVMQRVSGAIRGEAESAEVLGVALNDQRLAALAAAEGMTGWNTTMTDAEKAAFRFKVFLADTATAQGAAAERSEDLSAKVNAMKLRIQDATAAFGGFLGPIGESTAVLGDLSLAMPLVGAGAGKAVAGIKSLTDTARLASLGTSALSLALGPAGLVAGVGLAAGGIALLATQLDDDYVPAADKAAELTTSLANTYAALAASLDSVNEQRALQTIFQDLAAITSVGPQNVETLGDINTAIDELNRSELTWMDADNFGQLSEANALWLDSAFGNGDAILSMEELTKAQAAYAGSLLVTDDQLKAMQGDITELMGRSEIDTMKAAQAIQQVIDNLEAGTITADQAVDQIDALNQEWSQFTEFTLEAGNAMSWAEAQMGGWTMAARRHYIETQKNIHALADWIDGQTEHTHAVTENIAELVAADRAAQELAGAYGEIDHRATGAAAGIGTVTGAAAANSLAIIDLDTQLGALNETLTDTGAEGLERTFDMIVGFTGGMVNSIGTARDWADALIAPVGVYSELDTLLANNKISLDEYNEAQQAQIDITNAYGRAQTASNQIQAQNADLIADQAAATADYIETIAGLPEQEQLLELAWSNQDISGRANDIAGMAANFDDMSVAQQDAFENMVTSAAATDPALAAVLESLGLIKADVNDPTGWTVDMETSDADTAIEQLNSTMQDFILLLDPTYIARMDVDDQGALKRAGIALELFAYDNSTHTTGLDADATGFWNAVNSIPDSVGSRYIDVYYRTAGTVGGNVGIGGLALGGMVPFADVDQAALGRVSAGNLTLVGERGPELVNLPGGSLVTPNHATRFRPEVSGGGDIHIHGDVIVNGVHDSQSFMRQMRSYVTTMERR